MSYAPPINVPVPIGKVCDYCNENDAQYYIKSRNKWCCTKTVMQCPGVRKETKKRNKIKKQLEDELKKKHPIFNLEHVKVLYPHVYDIDVKEEIIRFNSELKVVEAKCTYQDCDRVWFPVPRSLLNLREWALRPCEDHSEPMDGYRYYCSDECKNKCFAYGKSGVTLERDIKLSRMIDWEEEEWYDSRANKLERDIWRKQCLERDDYSCVRCGHPAVHVHHIYPCKTHPLEELDPGNGISVCKFCHYVYFHQRGTICALNELAKKICFPIVFGEARRPAEKVIPLPPGVLTC
jgi:hypothetical protein